MTLDTEKDTQSSLHGIRIEFMNLFQSCVKTLINVVVGNLGAEYSGGIFSCQAVTRSNPENLCSGGYYKT